jgi:hypothetical protein
LAVEVNGPIGHIIDAASPPGRPLFAANRDIAPIDDPVAQLWQHCTTLREHRGEGHVIALAAADIDGCQAHQLLIAAQGFAVEVFRDNRGWTHERWDAASERLKAIGLINGDTLTDAGKRIHDQVEQLTDSLAHEPIAQSLTETAINSLIDSLTSSANKIFASGVVPFPNPMGLPSASV